MSIVITTPTGNIGKRALQQLLQAGADVSVIVRHPEKLSDSIRNRVKVHQGSLTDVDLVTKAFLGAGAALWLTPVDYTHPDAAAYHNEMGAVAATAIRKSRIPYVVNLSSAGSHLENAGPVSGLGIGASPGFARALVEMYQALAQLGADAEPRTPETTTPTTLREWSVKVFRPLFIA
jgi:uncharacterized protein YbjT (DUF2867 family)